MLNISVIIPTYNRAHLLKRSITSVLEQTFPVDEIIIVDDFSTDDTRRVVESIESKKIKYLVNSFTKGANGARNTGIMHAKGRYIAFQDSDDRWMPKKAAKQYQFMNEHPSADMVFCSLNLKGSKRGIVPKRKVVSDEIETQLEKGNFISTQTIFLKRDMAQNLLFDECLKRFQDWDFVLRAARNYNVYHLDEVLVEAEVQNDSISKKVNEIEALGTFFQKYPDLVNAHLVNKSLYNKVLFHQYTEKEEAIRAMMHFTKYFLYKHFDRVINWGRKL